VISYEDWLSNPLKYYEQILNFFQQELYDSQQHGNGFKSKDDLSFLEINFLTTKNEKKTKFHDEVMTELECYYLKYNQRINEMLGQNILKIRNNISCEKYSFENNGDGHGDGHGVNGRNENEKRRSMMVKQIRRREEKVMR
jgi:hypothetical protein